MNAQKNVIVVMGVAGSGKSTVAELVAHELGWTLTEADDLHSPDNVEKMAAGTPLTDADREPWLRLICRRIERTDGDQVVACSALRRRYRDILGRTNAARVRFLHLEGSRDLIGSRLDARTGHFMPSTMLQSQLDTLEPLAHDEDGASITIDGSPQDILRRALTALDLNPETAE
ncbi:MAG TPA: gluconokinase [Microlunatus sp.]|nr:gluconokinase [Microlunatus sp.]